MVYEGRRSRSAYAHRRAGRGKKGKKSGGGKVFSACLWILFIVVAASLAWPEAAAKVRSKAAELIGGPDISGAAQVFGQSMGEGSGVIRAFKDAWAYAFSTDGGGDIPASGDSGGAGEPVSENDGPSAPVMGEINDVSSDQTDLSDMPADPVEAFKQSQSKYEELGLPRNVTYDMPALNVELTCPVVGTVTSGFGYRKHPADGEVRFHYGLDIGAAEGSEIHAAADGEVMAVGDSTSYGRYVIIKHSDGLESLYAHMKETSVAGGSTLSAGDVIGTVGATGNATSACLHMELIIDGNYVNPNYYLRLQ